MTNEQIIQKFEQQKKKYLTYSLLLDLGGMATYLLPALGEAFDLIYAPFYGIAIYSLYRVKLGKGRAALGGMFGAVEEFMPLMDIIPSATLAWVYTYNIRRKATLTRFTKQFKNDRDVVMGIMSDQPRLSLMQRIGKWFGSQPYPQSEEVPYEELPHSTK